MSDRVKPFNWLRDGAVVVKEQSPIAVYVNPGRDVVIRQRAAPYECEDKFIFVAPENARALVDAILIAADSGGPTG